MTASTNDCSDTVLVSEELVLPSNVHPGPYPIRDQAKLAELSSSLGSRGWDGRPLLAIQRADRIVPLTGSYRLAAARRHGVPVPLLLIALPPSSEMHVQCAELWRLLLRSEDDVDLLQAFRVLWASSAVPDSVMELMEQELPDYTRVETNTYSEPPRRIIGPRIRSRAGHQIER